MKDIGHLPVDDILAMERGEMGDPFEQKQARDLMARSREGKRRAPGVFVADDGRIVADVMSGGALCRIVVTPDQAATLAEALSRAAVEARRTYENVSPIAARRKGKEAMPET